MRKIAVGAGFALVMTSAPAFAATCPPDRAAAAALLETLPELGDSFCSFPCSEAADFDASGLMLLGVKPERVQRKLDRSKTIQSLVFQLPGNLKGHAAPFKKAFAGSTCSSHGDHCWWTEQQRADDKSVQANLYDDPNKAATYLHCDFQFME